MDYFNLNNFYSTSSAPEELDAYPVLDQTSAGEVADNHNQAFGTFAHGWDMVERPGPMVGSLTSPRATIGHEPVASADSYTTPYTAEDNGYGQPTYSGHYWPTAGHQAQSHNSGLSDQDGSSLSWYGSFDSTMGSGAYTMAPNLSSGAPDYWEESQSGPSTSTFYANVRPQYQPGTGPTRTRPIQTGRFQPYGTSRACANEHRNVEAGPSTLVPPPVPYVGPPTQLSGGSSETAADARTNQTTEKDKATTTQTKLPRGKGLPRPQRKQAQSDTGKLCAWVKLQEGRKVLPTINEALAVAAKIIPESRPLDDQKRCLLTGKGKRKAVSSNHAEREFRRRNMERQLLQDLSQYYPLREGQSGWSRQALLSLIVKELEDRSTLPGPSNQPDP